MDFFFVFLYFAPSLDNKYKLGKKIEMYPSLVLPRGTENRNASNHITFESDFDQNFGV